MASIDKALKNVMLNQQTGTLSQAAPIASGQLVQNLQSRGATDPSQLNFMLQDIERQTQLGQEQALGGLSRGVGGINSGLSHALGAAIGMGGANRRARTLATEAQMREQRNRGDISTALGLINPGIAFQNNLAQQELLKQQQSQQTKGALIGAAGTVAGGAFGGPLGASIGGALAQKATGTDGGGGGAAGGAQMGDLLSGFF